MRNTNQRNEDGNRDEIFVTTRDAFSDKNGDRSGVSRWGYDENKKISRFHSFTALGLQEMLRADFYNPSNNIGAWDFKIYLENQARKGFKDFPTAKSRIRIIPCMLDENGNTYRYVMWPPTEQEKVIPIARPLPDGSLRTMKFWVYDHNSLTAVIRLPLNPIRVSTAKDFFKAIRENKFHLETARENDIEYLDITSTQYDQKRILEKLRFLSNGLYLTMIQMIKSNLIILRAPIDEETYMLWHDRLGHQCQNTMLRAMNASHGHPLRGKNFVINLKSLCQACSIRKTHLKPLHVKDTKVVSRFLERIQGDICGPIQPTCGAFKYFMVLVDASTRWSHVALLSTRNAVFPKLLAQIIKLRAHHPDYPIKSIRLDNTVEFTLKMFSDYYMTLGIDLEHPIAYVHSQNGLAEAFIKEIQIIPRTLVMRTKLPISAWGYAVLHEVALVRLRPIATQPLSAYQLVTGYEPDVSHIRVFGCLVNVPIEPQKRSKFGPQTRRRIYVGYESPSIIHYLEPLKIDLFNPRHADCDFDEKIFMSLGGDLHVNVDEERREITWHIPNMSHMYPSTAHGDKEVQRILSLQNVANQLPDAFNDLANVMRSNILVANVPARIDAMFHLNMLHRSYPPCKGRCHQLSSLPLFPRKEEDRSVPKMFCLERGEILLHPFYDTRSLSITGVYWRNDILKRNEIVIDDVFIYIVATDIVSNDDMEPHTIVECQNRTDWPNGNKQSRKRNENNEIVRYKARLMARSFSQHPGIDYDETYSPVMDVIIFRYLISLVVSEKLNMQLMDVVTAYLYGELPRLVPSSLSLAAVKPCEGFRFVFEFSDDCYKLRRPPLPLPTVAMVAVVTKVEGSTSGDTAATTTLQLRRFDRDLDTEIYMKVPDGLKLHESSSSRPRNTFSIRLRRLLYGLKKSGRMWYNRLSKYLIKLGYLNNEICPCVFIKKSISGYAIVAVYVDDMNLIETSKELFETAEILQIEHPASPLTCCRSEAGSRDFREREGSPPSAVFILADLDTEIYMKVPDGLKLHESSSSRPRNTFSIRLRRLLYGLKKSGRMWYNRLSKYLIKLGYLNNEICPCVFIKKSISGYAIVAVYVDDMNLIETSKELFETAEILQIEHPASPLTCCRSEAGSRDFREREGSPPSAVFILADLDTEIYMKVPDGLKLHESSSSRPRNTFSIRLRRSLYGLKKSGRMWYNRLSKYLIKLGYLNNEICPCVFIKKSISGYAIVAVYVDDMNLIETSKELFETAEILQIEHPASPLTCCRSEAGSRDFREREGSPPSAVFILADLDTEIYMKVPDGLKLHESSSSRPRNTFSIRLRRSLYGLKKSGRMWYNRLSKYLIKLGYLNNEICPCVFIKKSISGYAIVAVYVDDMNLIETSKELFETAEILQIEHPASPLTCCRSEAGSRDFREREGSPPSAVFILAGTTDMGLFYPYASSSESSPNDARDNATFVSYADAGYYLLDPHKGRSQSGYVFTIGNTVISWRSCKQILVATLTNHSELLALYEATRECVWLRAVIGHIRSTCDLAYDLNELVIIYEDKTDLIDQAKHGYIKGDTKHISPKLFFTHEQQVFQKIEVQHIGSDKNHADLFTISLPKYSFQKHVKAIGLRKLSELHK
ncbi:hypothetical protein LXL04_028704 [Taraxacum kok-saghyz]